MTVHVIQLENLEKQVTKLEEILRIYEKQWKSLNEELITHDLDSEIDSLKNFRKEFETVIEEAIKEKGEIQEDIYGNQFEKEYQYAEVTFGGYKKFDKIRLLGVGKKRFFISDVEHDFSPTTISLITNIREIIREPFDINDFLDLCGQSVKEQSVTKLEEKSKKKTRYTWLEVANKFFIPKAVTEQEEELTDEAREKLQEKYKKSFLTKEQLDARNREIQSKKRALLEKARKDTVEQKKISEKIAEEVRKQQVEQNYRNALNTLGKFVDRYSFSCLLQEAIECVVPKNISCEALFKDLAVTEIFDRLSIIFPRGNDTFKELEKLVEENLFGNTSSLKQQIQQTKNAIDAQEKAIKSLECEECEKEALDVAGAILQENQEKLTQLEKELEEERARIYRDLRLTERQQQLARRDGNLFFILSNPETEEEELGAARATDRVLKVIDTIIPLEDLCGLLIQSLTLNFDLSAFKFPQLRPVNDIFGGFSAEIETAFLQAIVQAILLLVQTMLNELFNCDNLDNIVAAAVAGVNENFASLSNLELGSAAAGIGNKIAENSEKFGVYSDLVTMFGGSTPNIAASFEKNYDDFVRRISPVFERTIKISADGAPGGNKLSANVGISSGITEDLLTGDLGSIGGQLQQQLTQTATSIRSNRSGILDFFLTQGPQGQIADWDIDSTGEKFIISDGITILDLGELDKTINASIRDFVNSIPEDLLTEELFLRIAEEEKGQISFAPSSTEQQLVVSDETIKKEMSSVVNNFISIASPTEVIQLMSGKGSKESLSLIREVMNVTSPTLSSVFTDHASIKNLFKQFGKSTGLGELLPKMNLLASAPEANLKLVPPKLCAPFNNVDNFRKALLARVVPLQTAEKIFDSINKEKIKKYNDLVDTLIGVSAGNLPEIISSDPKAKFLDEVRKNILYPTIKETEVAQDNSESKDKKQPKNSADMIRKEMSEKTNNSPIYQSMLETTLSSIFNPIRESFDSDMEAFVKGYITKQKVEKKIPREITLQTVSGSQKVINPEFKDFINAGLAPIVQLEEDGEEREYAELVDKSSLEVDDEGNLTDLRVSGNPNTNFLKPGWSIKRLLENPFTLGFEDEERVKKPVIKTTTKNIAGSVFKEALSISMNDKMKMFIDKENFIIRFEEIESPNSVLPDLLANATLSNTFSTFPLLKSQVEDGTPRWNLQLRESKSENKERTTIDIETTGVSVTPIKGFEQFYPPSSNTSKAFLIEESTRQAIAEKYGSSDYPLKTRGEVFEEFFISQLKNSLDNFDQIEQSFRDSMNQKQQKMIKSAVSSMVESFANTRLFQQTDIGGNEVDEKLVFLQLFDFTRKPTELEKECGFDPHIMGFDGLYKKFKEIYENEPEVEQEEKELNGLSKKRTRFGNAAYKIMTEVILRLQTVDFVLKTLPVFDVLSYSGKFADIEILNDILLNQVEEDMKKMGIYDSFKRELKNQISEMPKAEKTTTEREPNLEDCRSPEELSKEGCDEFKEQQASTANKRRVGEQEYKQELKKMLADQLQQVLGKLADIFGFSRSEKQKNVFTAFFIDGLPLYDVHDNEQRSIYETENIKNVYVKEVDIRAASSNTRLKDIAKRTELTNTEKLRQIGEVLKEVQSSFTGALWKNTLKEQVIVQEDLLEEGDMFLEKYVKVGKMTSSFKNLAQYRKLRGVQDSVVSIDTFRNILIDLQEDVDFYNCDDPSSSLFQEPIRFGLRASYVYQKNNFSSSNGKYFYVGSKKGNLNSSAIKSKELAVKERKNYSILKIAEQEEKINSNATVKQMREIISQEAYDQVFFPALKERISKTKEVNIIFDYCVPLKEISVMSLINSFLINNGEQQKYLFEPTKSMIKNIFEILEDMGDKTKSAEKLAALKERQKREMMNEGNPAGPLNFEALKIFLRTPIHILKGLATIVDPNIFIADKIVAGVAAAGSLVGQNIYIPYGLTSVALLPFPLFTPVTIPPLTAYNIAVPLGPIFLALEPLLWDLPWFKLVNGDPNNPNKARNLESFGVSSSIEEICADNKGQEFIEQEIARDTIDFIIEQIKKTCDSQ